MTTPSTLRVLLLGDDPDEPARLTRELSGAFPDLTVQLVRTAAELDTALKAPAFDAVLADTRLSWAPFRDIVAALSARAADLPFLILLARGGADAAVEALMGTLVAGIACTDGSGPGVAEVLRHLLERAGHRQFAEEMRALVAALGDVMIVLDADGRYLRIAPSGADLLYRPPETVLGRTLHEVFPQAEADLFLGQVRTALRTRETQRLEYSLPIADRQVWFEASISPLSETTVLLVARDATTRVRAEKVRAATQRIAEAVNATRDLTELLRAIHAIVGDLMPALNYYVALYDPATETVSFPYSVDEYDPPRQPRRLGHGMTEYVLRTGQPTLVTADDVQDLIRRGEVTESGAPSVSWLGIPLVIENRTIGVLAVQSYTEGKHYGQNDIEILRFVSTQIALAIERKQAETALRDSEDRYRRLVESSPDAMVVYSEGTIRYINRAAAQLFGVSGPPDLVGRPVLDFVHPDSRPLVLARMRQTVVARVDVPLSEERFVRPDGSVIDAEVAAIPIVWDGRAAALATIRDISARVQAETALRRVDEQQRALVDGVRDTIFAVTAEGILTALNRAFEESTGWARDEWLGRSILEIVHPEDVEVVTRLLRRAIAREPRPLELFRVRTKDGGFRLTEASVNAEWVGDRVVSLLGIARDITERTALEQKLRQSQKMEAVGQLAGGIAHDFNNLLTAINVHAELLLPALAEGDPRRAEVEEIHRAADRAAGLTHQLLAYSRRQVLQPKVLDLNTIVYGAETLVRRVIGEDIRVVTRLARTLGAVRADPGQIEQVILNLALNARDAMPEGGILTLATQDRTFDPTTVTFTAEQSTAGPGPYVELTVTDTGVGMDAETRTHVFEPFFTTKEVGRGTGLGLSTVYGIVKQSGGFIWVESEPGRGASFHVALPRVEVAPASPEPATPTPRAAAGAETILITEDEPGVRAAARTVLSRLGYRVLEAESGDAALRVASSHPGTIDLLLTDVVMPGMNGRVLAEQLTRLRPGLRVVYMSGYPNRVIVRQGILEPGLAFLAKPFTPRTLGEKVRETLDAREATTTPDAP